METAMNEEYQKFINRLQEVKVSLPVNSLAYDKLKEVIENMKKLTESNVQQFLNITNSMAKTYENKNHDYGDSFKDSLDEFGIIAAVTRMSDKMNRIKSLVKKEAKVKDESIKDTLLDLATYCIMTVMWLNDGKKGN